MRSDSGNAPGVYRALAAFGAPLETIGVSASDLATRDTVLQIGLPPRRIDILNHSTGISFEEAISEGSSFELDGIAIPVIGLAALMKNKRMTAREQDFADVRALEKIHFRETGS